MAGAAGLHPGRHVSGGGHAGLRGPRSALGADGPRGREGGRDGAAEVRGGWRAPVGGVTAAAGFSVFVAAAPVLALAGYVRLLEILVGVPVAVVLAVGRLADGLVLVAAVVAVGAVQS